jgi:hypothetical protein
MKMKLVFLRSVFLVLIAGLVMSSCKKDKTTDPIIGIWTTGTSTFSVMVGDKTLIQYFVDVMGYTQSEAESSAATFETLMQLFFTGTMTFKSNNTYTSNLGGTADSGTWSLNTDQTVLTIVSSSEGPMAYNVIKLTSSELHLQISGTLPYDLNNDETDEILNVDIDLTLTK